MRNITIIFLKKVSNLSLDYIPFKNNFNDYLDEQFNNNVNPFKNIALNTKVISNNIKKDLDYIINNNKKKDDNDFLSDLVLVQNINEFTFKKDLNNLKKTIKSDVVSINNFDNNNIYLKSDKTKNIEKLDNGNKKKRVQTAIKRNEIKSLFTNQNNNHNEVNDGNNYEAYFTKINI